MANGVDQTFVRVLLSGLTVAFMAWAGVVWNQSSKILENQTVIRENLATITGAIANLNRRVSNHSDKKWHNEAGNELSSLREKVENIKQEHQWMKGVEQ